MAKTYSPGGRGLKLIIGYFLLSFLLHWIWEVAQMPLYVDDQTFCQHVFGCCLVATSTGDMIFMLMIYLSLAIVHRDVGWIAHRSSFLHPATWILPIIIG